MFLSLSSADVFISVLANSTKMCYTYDEHIQVGKTATFVTAPKYYGDGYVMPIVSLSINDQHILEYEIGFPSLLHWLKNNIIFFSRTFECGCFLYIFKKYLLTPTVVVVINPYNKNAAAKNYTF